MKTSNSKIFLIIALPICVAARILQIIYTVEPKTGFFIETMHLPAFLLCGLIGLSVLVTALTSLVIKTQVISKNRVAGVISFLLGLAVLYEAYAFNITDYTLKGYYIAYLVLSVLGSAGFIIYGISSFAKFKTPYLLLAATVLFWTLKAVIIFTSYATVSALCEHVFELCALCASCLFLYNLARVRAEIPGKKTSRLLLCFGEMSALLCFVNTVSYVFALLSNTQSTLHSSLTFGISNTLFGLFALSEVFGIKNEETDK